MSTLREQGFGCMGFSAFHSSAETTTVESARQVLLHALKNGVTLLNTASFYGPLNEEGYGANLRLLREALDGVGRSSYRLMVKIGMDTRCPKDKTGTQFIMRGDEESLRADVQYSLQQLGTTYLDIAVLCRVPTDVPIEDSMKTLVKLREEGLIREIGLSEASAQTIRKASKITPLYCIEQEWSLLSRDLEEELVPTCRELGIKIVAYSPLGKGVLSSNLRSRDVLSPFLQNAVPKFSEENFDSNIALLSTIDEIAKELGVTTAQVALAWVHHRGNDVIPIPGTTRIERLNENLAARDLILSPEVLQRLESVFTVTAISGERYPHNHGTFVEN